MSVFPHLSVSNNEGKGFYLIPFIPSPMCSVKIY